MIYRPSSEPKLSAIWRKASVWGCIQIAHRIANEITNATVTALAVVGGSELLLFEDGEKVMNYLIPIWSNSIEKILLAHLPKITFFDLSNNVSNEMSNSEKRIKEIVA